VFEVTYGQHAPHVSALAKIKHKENSNFSTRFPFRIKFWENNELPENLEAVQKSMGGLRAYLEVYRNL